MLSIQRKKIKKLNKLTVPAKKEEIIFLTTIKKNSNLFYLTVILVYSDCHSITKARKPDTLYRLFLITNT